MVHWPAGPDAVKIDAEEEELDLYGDIMGTEAEKVPIAEAPPATTASTFSMRGMVRGSRGAGCALRKPARFLAWLAGPPLAGGLPRLSCSYRTPCLIAWALLVPCQDAGSGEMKDDDGDAIDLYDDILDSGSAKTPASQSEGSGHAQAGAPAASSMAPNPSAQNTLSQPPDVKKKGKFIDPLSHDPLLASFKTPETVTVRSCSAKARVRVGCRPAVFGAGPPGHAAAQLSVATNPNPPALVCRRCCYKAIQSGSGFLSWAPYSPC